MTATERGGSPPSRRLEVLGQCSGEPVLRYVTGALNVSYLKPTPLGPMLEIRGRVKEIKGRKVVVEEWIVAGGASTVRGEVVAVQLPSNMAGV